MEVGTKWDPSSTSAVGRSGNPPASVGAGPSFDPRPGAGPPRSPKDSDELSPRLPDILLSRPRLRFLILLSPLLIFHRLMVFLHNIFNNNNTFIRLLLDVPHIHNICLIPLPLFLPIQVDISSQSNFTFIISEMTAFVLRAWFVVTFFEDAYERDYCVGMLPVCSVNVSCSQGECSLYMYKL